MDDDVQFTIRLRGYDVRQVDELVAKAHTGEDVRAALPQLRIVLRGYDRQQVDSYFNQPAS
jgi:DivIVA domain-containing protein